METSYDSEFSNVTFMDKDNIVLITWKKFCCFDDYRKPTLFASRLLRENPGSNFVIDARNGFEDEKEDVEWGFKVLLPHMAESSCRMCVFIVNEVPTIEEELDLWTAEFKKYFQVYKVRSYEEAVGIISAHP